MFPMPADTLNIALACLKAHPNWFLFPIKRLEKYPPCFTDNLRLASNDPAQIKEWYKSYPGCNWGVSLKKSGLICVDVDRKPGKNGGASLEALETKYGVLPDSLTIMTPTRGLHIYYNETDTVKHRMRQNAFGEDIDSTNYTLIPGCWLSSSADQYYEIVNDVPVIDAPAWFAEFLADKPEIEAVEQTPAVEQDTDDIIQEAIYFLQNDARPSVQFKNGEFALLMTAATLKDMGVSKEKAIELLAEYYNVSKGDGSRPYCEPLWEIGDGPMADRLDVKVTNAWNYCTQLRPGTLTAIAEFGGDDPSDFDPATHAPTASAIEAQAAWRETMENARIEREAAAAKEARELREANKKADKAAVEEAVAEATALPRGDWEVEPEAEPPTDGSEEIDAEEPAPEVTTNLPLCELDEIDETIKPAKLKVLCERWVWVTGIERWVNRLDPTTQWSRKQFDSEFNYLVKGPSVSNILFKNRELVRRFRKIAFRPGAPETAGVMEYNVWRPSPITPMIGDTRLWNEHINYLFQNEDDAKKVLDWMAWVLQNESKKPNHALLIVGKNTGTGKSFVARVFEQLIGVRNTQRPKNSSMGGDFNSWLINCRLCIIEEVYQADRRSALMAMRDLITEARCEVNMKGIPAFTMDNFVSILGVSNHGDALPIDKRDRRWLVIETNAYRKEVLDASGEPVPDRNYYGRLFAILSDPAALGAIYDELLARPLVNYSGADPAPVTEAKQEMIAMSRNDAETWLDENRGNPPLSRRVTSIGDIVGAMTNKMQNTPRLATVLIPNFLRDSGWVKLKNQRRLSDGRKVYLWVQQGLFSMRGGENATGYSDLYEEDLKKDVAKSDAQADEDFGS